LHDEFNLLLFSSRTRSWSTKKLAVESPVATGVRGGNPQERGPTPSPSY
jgi:hypothetical protein